MRAKKPTMMYLPARHYRPVAGIAMEVEDLPFLWFDSQHGLRWNMVQYMDYTVGTDVGKECGAHFVQLLRDNPYTAKDSSLDQAVKALGKAPHGVMIGFFEALSSLLAEPETIDPFSFVAAEIKRGNDAMAKADAAIEAAREASELEVAA